jgi:hypothetical protein
MSSPQKIEIFAMCPGHKVILKNKVPMCMYFNIQQPTLKSNVQINSIPIEVLAKPTNFGSENRLYILIIAISLTNMQPDL